MEKVFIIHPLKGKGEGPGERVQNEIAIARIARVMAKAGLTPYSPVHACRFLDDHVPHERETGMRIALELLKDAGRAWAFGEFWDSTGCKKEILTAAERGIRLDGNLILVHNHDDPGKPQNFRRRHEPSTYRATAGAALFDLYQHTMVIVDARYMPGVIELLTEADTPPGLRITLHSRTPVAEYWRIEMTGQGAQKEGK